MAIAPVEFLEAARNLNDGDCIESEEPRSRTILGRLYYASYLTVRDAVRGELDDPTFTPQSHRSLARTLKSSGDPDVDELGLALDQLRDERTTSDYYLNRHVQAFQSAIQFANAQLVVNNAVGLAPRFPSIPRRR